MAKDKPRGEAFFLNKIERETNLEFLSMMVVQFSSFVIFFLSVSVGFER